MCITQSVLLVALFVGLAHSWDIAVTAGDRLEFYTDDGKKTDTVSFDSKHLTALAYDEVHNMLLYVDSQTDNDAIYGYNMTSVEYKCYIERSGRNIQGLAFDPVTELLFFTDIKERSINWFSFKTGTKNNVRGNLLIKTDDGIPTDIAVDSCRGYVYWINANLSTSTIERARFNGTDREVVIKSKYNLDLHGLAIDQQTRKIYWYMPVTRLGYTAYRADLNGENMESLVSFKLQPDNNVTFVFPNTILVSKEFVFAEDWCISCGPMRLWKFSKPMELYNYKEILQVHTKHVFGMVANYKLKDQFQGISECNQELDYDTNDSFKIAKEYEGPYCVHGIKVNGHSLCKCTSGYTGERCEVSVCENFCLQGNCSIIEDGLPKCRCNAGYTGERCEVNMCYGYCLNNGTCSLNEEDEVVCECTGEHEGERCDVPIRQNNGDGSVNEEVGIGTACQCVGSQDSSGRKTDKNEPVTTTSTHYSPEGNLKISVIVELKSNNRNDN